MSRIEGATGSPLAEHPPHRVRLQGLFGPGGLAEAAAVLGVVGLLVWNTSLREENEDLRADLQTRQAYEMRGSGIAQNVRGEVVRMRDSRSVLMAENLPSPPEGQIYEAWIMRNDVPEPAGLFEPHDGIAATPIEGSIEGADAVAVAMEQDGGSSTPTSGPFLTTEL